MRGFQINFDGGVQLILVEKTHLLESTSLQLDVVQQRHSIQQRSYKDQERLDAS